MKLPLRIMTDRYQPGASIRIADARNTIVCTVRSTESAVAEEIVKHFNREHWVGEKNTGLKEYNSGEWSNDTPR